jgi:peptidoglycan/xylan/chitin deacetylase (PgdA/CDA1 family)
MTRWRRRALTALPGASLAEPLLRLFRRPPVILMYHGVAMDERPQWLGSHGKHLPFDAFVAQMRQLRRFRRVLPLTQMVEGLRSGADLDNTVAITFDDGYRNNVTRAAPPLIDLRLPASFFLSTGHIGTGRWMWSDRLERAIGLAARVEVSIPMLRARISLRTDDDRVAALQRTKVALKAMPADEVEKGVAEIEAALGVASEPPSGDAAFMDWDGARQLAAAGFEVGAHTVNHVILSRVAPDRAREEIIASRERVAAELGACSPVFCYPNGREADYTAGVVEICRAHFLAALSTNRGAARRDELYQLRRLGAPSDGSPARMMSLLLRQR